MERMTALGPTFIDVTWGAGGSTADITTQMVRTAHEQMGLETCMHLTCTNMPVEQVEQALKEAKEHGCENILALRGDPPHGQAEWTKTEGGFEHAIDLIRYIRKNYGDHFDIAIAGFPEGHPQAGTREEELQYVKDKVDAGANLIITQMFYDSDVFIQWARDLRKLGVQVPIVPGIMPIQNWSAFIRRTSFAKTIIPQCFYDALRPIQEDDQAVRDIGTKLVADMCRRILDAKDLGICGFHFYTMNLEKGTIMLLQELGITAAQDVVSPLPWRPALTSKRRQEDVRPIFWANRHKSYLARTSSWDEFPNGRWGDSRSPAFGDLDGYGISLKFSAAECREMWNDPQSLEDIRDLFVRFCNGEIKALPWSEMPTSSETSVISKELAEVNKMGFLTINSQPAVDGVCSSHPVHGWGPRFGYVYQKAYLEFFCSPEAFSQLVPALNADPYISYFAVTKRGDLHTNTNSDTPNAVTWGVFPGKEIVQPTIVERISFMAWKDEAFELGKLWANVYPVDSTSRKVIGGLFDNWFLVNVVRNDFRNPDKLAIFKPFFDTATSSARLPKLKPTNGAEHHDETIKTDDAVEGLMPNSTLNPH